MSSIDLQSCYCQKAVKENDKDKTGFITPFWVYYRLKRMYIRADDSKPFIIKCDASAYAIEAVLIQGEGENERTIEYASRLLSNAEINYSTTEREALSIA